MKERCGGELAASAEEVIARAEAIYVTSPNRTHVGYALAALEAGRHVFCEKPFALNLAEAEKVRAAAERSGKVYQLGFNRRFAPAYAAMKSMIANGELTPRSFNIKMNRGELQHPAWTSDATVTGGFLFESTLHLFDMVRFLFGEVAEVQAVGRKGLYPCVDSFSLLLTMESGVHGVFSSCAHASWHFPFERVEIYGDHATVQNDEMESVSWCLGLAQPTELRRFGTLPHADRWGFRTEDTLFLRRIQGQRDDRICQVATAVDGWRNVEFIERVYALVGLGR